MIPVVCPEGWVATFERCVKAIFNDTKLSYPDASSSCSDEGADSRLLHIDTVPGLTWIRHGDKDCASEGHYDHHDVEASKIFEAL